MADIFDVVADPTRRVLLNLLLDVSRAGGRRGELSVGEIVERLSLTQPTVSKHLKVLRDHGLVSAREDGQHRYYRLDSAPLEELDGWLAPFLEVDAGTGEAPGSRGDVSTPFAAWSGVDAGEKIGRIVADRSHRTRAAVQSARSRVGLRIRRSSGG